MTRHHTPDGDLHLGTLIMTAYGLDRGWVVRAACLEYAREYKPTFWQVEYNYREQREDGSVLRGQEMIAVALAVCATCPAQYDCARYAVEGRMTAGTWAMPAPDLEWMQSSARRSTWEAIIDEAEEQGVPVQVAVVAARGAD